MAAAKLKYDWYQNETHVILNILHKNVVAEKLQVECCPNEITITLQDFPNSLKLYLFHDVHAEEIVKKITSSKVEIKLPKVEALHWSKLEDEARSVQKAPESSAEATVKPKSKNWDEVVNNEKVDEEDALNDLFKKIYSEGSDEVKKAMNKSFMESGGTVLSTNWGEVREDKVAVKPPDGVEFRKWD